VFREHFDLVCFHLRSLDVPSGSFWLLAAGMDGVGPAEWPASVVAAYPDDFWSTTEALKTMLDDHHASARNCLPEKVRREALRYLNALPARPARPARLARPASEMSSVAGGASGATACL
jgi:hypothetical protein